MSEQEGFLQRWSRRKADARHAEQHEPEAAPAAEPEEQATPQAGSPERALRRDEPGAAARTETAEETIDLAALPDIESLTYESDFTPFLRAGVPQELKNRALRKLWRSNPVLACLDGLNDHDEDYTDAALVRPGIKTLYKVGRGLLREPASDPQVADLEAPDGAARQDEKRAGRGTEAEGPDTRNELDQSSGEAGSEKAGASADERA
jgi:hypothetical protein